MSTSSSLVPGFVRSAASAFGDRLTVAVGGPARRRTILLLAGVLSLQSADGGAVGADADEQTGVQTVESVDVTTCWEMSLGCVASCFGSKKSRVRISPPRLRVTSNPVVGCECDRRRDLNFCWEWLF